jgi:hypothetical protein
MAMNKTKYLRKKVLDHVMHRIAFTYPTEVYMALFSADPTEEGLQTNEIAEGGYARVAISALLADAILASGQISNNADIQFAPPLEDWSEITHGAIMDAATAGNMLYFGPATSSRIVTFGGDPFKIRIGQLIILER